MSDKIVFISAYFGKLPWYFDYFLKSCVYNENIDFLIFSDDILSKQKLPSNVRIVTVSFVEMKRLICEKLKIEVEFDNPYKLCDFKPAYGVIFSEYIQGYDFWAHGDIDVIFGNIRDFITEDVLRRHDLICVRHDFLTGYFTLFRNTGYINNLFRESRDYITVFTSSKHFCFDETNFCFEQFTNEIHHSDISSEIDSMTHVAYRLNESGKIRFYADFHVIEGTPGKLKWENGRMFYKGKYEVMLYHLIRLKTIYSQNKPIKIIPDKFYISPSKIYFKK